MVRPAGPTRDATTEGLDSARRALARGQVGAAISRLQQLAEREPDVPEVRILLARALLASGRPRRAGQVLSEGLARDPDNHELAYWLARNRLEENRVQSALETLQVHAPEVEGAGDYHLLLGATLRQLGRHESAYDAYRRITDVSPDNMRAWLGRALSAEALDRIDDARQAYVRVRDGGDAQSAQFARRRLAALGLHDSQN